MSKKTYGVYGMVEWQTSVFLGNTPIRITFTGGCISVRGIDPATFKTSDPIVQLAIENSHFFKKDKIKLVLEEKSEDEVSSDEPIDNDGNVYPDVKTLVSAKEILRSKYNVDLSELQNKDSVLAKAESLGVKFPNWA